MNGSSITPTVHPFASLGLTLHDNGYLYKKLTWWKIEFVLIVWPPGTRSKAHQHGASRNLTWLIPLGEATLRTTFFKVMQDRLLSDRTETIGGNQFHYVAAHQIHEVANESPYTAVTLHAYFPCRQL
jgi:hypothetical protein